MSAESDREAIREVLRNTHSHGLTVEVLYAAFLAVQRGATIKDALWTALWDAL